MTVREYAITSNYEPPKTSMIETAYKVLLERFGDDNADTEFERNNIFERYQEHICYGCSDIEKPLRELASELVELYADYDEMDDIDIEEAIDDGVHEKILDLTLELLDDLKICPEF